MEKMTPLKVEILLWYFYSPVDFPNFNVAGVQEAIDDFCSAGICVRVDKDSNIKTKIYFHKGALDAYVKEILSIPLPKQIWIIPKNENGHSQ